MITVRKIESSREVCLTYISTGEELIKRCRDEEFECVHITDTTDDGLPYPEPFTEGITIGQVAPYNTPEGKDGKWFYCFIADYEFDQEALEEELKDNYVKF